MSMLTELQKKAYQNKVSHGWNTTDFNEEFEHIKAEVSEAEAAFSSGNLEEMVEELADIAIYLLGMAEMAGQDLGDAILHKTSIVAVRAYGVDGKRVYDSIRVMKTNELPPDEQVAVAIMGKEECRKGDTLFFFTDDALTNYKVGKVSHVKRTSIMNLLSVVWLPKYEADVVRELVLSGAKKE